MAKKKVKVKLKARRVRGNLQRAISNNASPSETTLGVMKDLVSVLVNNTTPSPSLADALRNYFNNLQQTTDLMGLAVFEHNISKLLRVSEGIEVLHKEVLDPKKIRKNIAADPSYGLELMKILYKESSVATLILEGKTKLFDTDKLKSAPHLQPPQDDLATEKISNLSPRRRTKITNIIESLLDDDDDDNDDNDDNTGNTGNGTGNSTDQ